MQNGEHSAVEEVVVFAIAVAMDEKEKRRCSSLRKLRAPKDELGNISRPYHQWYWQHFKENIQWCTYEINKISNHLGWGPLPSLKEGFM